MAKQLECTNQFNFGAIMPNLIEGVGLKWNSETNTLEVEGDITKPIEGFDGNLMIRGDVLSSIDTTGDLTVIKSGSHGGDVFGHSVNIKCHNANMKDMYNGSRLYATGTAKVSHIYGGQPEFHHESKKSKRWTGVAAQNIITDYICGRALAYAGESIQAGRICTHSKVAAEDTISAEYIGLYKGLHDDDFTRVAAMREVNYTFKCHDVKMYVPDSTTFTKPVSPKEIQTQIQKIAKELGLDSDKMLVLAPEMAMS